MNADRTKTGGTFSDPKAHAVAGTVTILQGNGDGSFQAPTYFEAGSGSLRHHSGKPHDCCDLVVANQFADTVAVLANMTP